jgi:hypothetical protein
LRRDGPVHAQVGRATDMAIINVEASDARRAIAGVIVLSSTQPGTTLHSSGEVRKTAVNHGGFLGAIWLTECRSLSRSQTKGSDNLLPRQVCQCIMPASVPRLWSLDTEHIPGCPCAGRDHRTSCRAQAAAASVVRLLQTHASSDLHIAVLDGSQTSGR